VIREATLADLSAVQRIAEQAFEPFVVAIGKKPAPMVADFAALIERGFVRVYETEAIVVGYCVSFAKDSVWHVENLAVAPAEMGTGVGRKLMIDAEDRAVTDGKQRVELYTNIAMTGALAFYPRLGYEETWRGVEDGFERVYFQKVLK